MLKTVVLKFGAGKNSLPLTLDASSLNVFVGPNNSGKSKALSELENICETGDGEASHVVIDATGIEFSSLSSEAASIAVEQIVTDPRAGSELSPGMVRVGRGPKDKLEVTYGELIKCLQNPHDANNRKRVCQWYLKFKTLRLDGKSRILLVEDQSIGDLQKRPQTTFQVLFRDKLKREQVRQTVLDAFKTYLLIDPSHGGKLRLRLSRRAPSDVTEEQGLHPDALKFQSEATLLAKTSDGVKAFTGILCEIVAGDPDVLLIDEPEAFLHPSLATALGKEIAIAGARGGKKLFVATHSPYFVMGCIQSGAPVNIVRLTYRDDVATARILKNEDLLRLMRNPLLRSTGVLSGLFYDFVVVTEGDADRAFYQEINERLLRFKPEWGIPNCLFLNAQNKDTLHSIIRPLREIGIPAVAIADIDILKLGGKTWTNFLNGGAVPRPEHLGYGQTRSAINSQLEVAGDMKKEGGVNLLKGETLEAANNLLDNLEEYGLFTIRGGELESWQKHLGISGKGPSWLTEVFEKMGEDPEAVDYVMPAEDDVWAFIRAIRQWLMNPNRKGIPA